MHPDARKLLWDARDAVERVTRFAAGKAFAHYEADELLRSAVERRLEIVGEVLGKLRQVDPETARKIQALPRAIGLRNVLIHGYATVDDRIVWGVVEANLPDLRSQIVALLDGVPNS